MRAALRVDVNSAIAFRAECIPSVEYRTVYGNSGLSSRNSATRSAVKSAVYTFRYASNAEQLASILADDFVDIGANGVRRTKQQNVEDTRAHVIQWMRLVAKNEHVQVFDSTAAVVTGEQEGAGTYRGQPFARTTRYLRVYLKRGGRWQNVAAESALIAP